MAERVCGNSIVLCCVVVELIEHCILTSLCVTLCELIPLSPGLTLYVDGENREPAVVA